MKDHASMGTDCPTFEFVSTAMSTTVSVQIVGEHPNAQSLAADALDWFRVVEATCSRFDPESELVRLCRLAPATIPVSPLLFEVLRVALAVAELTDGAFDPTVGWSLYVMGFDTNWKTGERLAYNKPIGSATWRDVRVNDEDGTVTLNAPLLLDLGGVAKGFALDLAVRAMAGVAHACIVAGGDVFCRGNNARARAWRTAIVDPFVNERFAAVVEVDAPEYAVCTSGGYRRATALGHHLLVPPSLLEAAQPVEVQSARSLASCTVVAPQAAVADALATAVFVLGTERGTELLLQQGADALLITPDGSQHTVFGWGRSHFTAHVS